jgi:hypothetical protein
MKPRITAENATAAISMPEKMRSIGRPTSSDTNTSMGATKRAI